MKEFASMGLLGRHFAAIAAQGRAVETHVVKDAAKIVKDDAGVRIGMYQEATGPFNAWAELATSTVSDRVRQGFTPFEPLYRTGELRGSIEAEVSGNQMVVGSKMDIALWQEQGTSKMPPRPFLGPALYDSRAKIGRSSATTLVAWIAGLNWRANQSIRLPYIDSKMIAPQKT